MYVLTRKAFEGLLGPYEEMWKFEVLRKVPILFALSEAQLFELARCMTSHRLKAGQTVFRQGDPGESASSSTFKDSCESSIKLRLITPHGSSWLCI